MPLVAGKFPLQRSINRLLAAVNGTSAQRKPLEERAAMSVVVRLPEDVYESARRIAALQGRQASDLIGEAWGQYLESHREQFAADFEQAAHLLRTGDTKGLTELASRSARVRADEAARAARQ
jgi:hypothetical protein